MSWYLIVLLIVFYIVMWSITTIALTRFAKNSDPGWVPVGMLWPLILMSIPVVAVIMFVDKVVDKYGYKEDSK